MISTMPRLKQFARGRHVRAGLVTAAVAGATVATLLAVTPPQMLLSAEEPRGPITGFAGKCVDVADGNPANGTIVQLYHCNGTEAQRWSNPGDGTLRAFGKCLDIAGGSTAAGASVRLWDCNGGSGQQWVFSAAQDIVNPAADKCLDVRAYISADRTPLQLWTCTGADNEKWRAAEVNNPAAEEPADGPAEEPADETADKPAEEPGGAPAEEPGGGDSSSKFVVSEDQFKTMFPNHNSVYSYNGLLDALGAYPAFANSGDLAAKKREAAAFLANVSHETGGLVHVVEQNKANYSNYCDPGRPYGCPAGQDAYYGRGPAQLSWNYNYKAAGDALGLDLLNNPALVETDSAVAWKVGLWYWNTQSGPGSMTPHDAMAGGPGFGETIRSINGALECGGANPAQVRSRIDTYQKFTQILGVGPGENLSC